MKDWCAEQQRQLRKTLDAQARARQDRYDGRNGILRHSTNIYSVEYITGKAEKRRSDQNTRSKWWTATRKP
jgi:hypothetical protein